MVPVYNYINATTISLSANPTAHRPMVQRIFSSNPKLNVFGSSGKSFISASDVGIFFGTNTVEYQKALAYFSTTVLGRTPSSIQFSFGTPSPTTTIPALPAVLGTGFASVLGAAVPNTVFATLAAIGTASLKITMTSQATADTSPTFSEYNLLVNFTSVTNMTTLVVALNAGVAALAIPSSPQFYSAGSQVYFGWSAQPTGFTNLRIQITDAAGTAQSIADLLKLTIQTGALGYSIDSRGIDVIVGEDLNLNSRCYTIGFGFTLSIGQHQAVDAVLAAIKIKYFASIPITKSNRAIWGASLAALMRSFGSEVPDGYPGSVGLSQWSFSSFNDEFLPALVASIDFSQQAAIPQADFRQPPALMQSTALTIRDVDQLQSLSINAACEMDTQPRSSDWHSDFVFGDPTTRTNFIAATGIAWIEDDIALNILAGLRQRGITQTNNIGATSIGDDIATSLFAATRNGCAQPIDSGIDDPTSASYSPSTINSINQFTGNDPQAIGVLKQQGWWYKGIGFSRIAGTNNRQFNYKLVIGVANGVSQVTGTIGLVQ